MVLCCIINSLSILSPDLDIKYIGGADPEMVLLSEESNEVQVCRIGRLG